MRRTIKWIQLFVLFALLSAFMAACFGVGEYEDDPTEWPYADLGEEDDDDDVTDDDDDNDDEDDDDDDNDDNDDNDNDDNDDNDDAVFLN